MCRREFSSRYLFLDDVTNETHCTKEDLDVAQRYRTMLYQTQVILFVRISLRKTFLDLVQAFTQRSLVLCSRGGSGRALGQVWMLIVGKE